MAVQHQESAQYDRLDEILWGIEPNSAVSKRRTEALTDFINDLGTVKIRPHRLDNDQVGSGFQFTHQGRTYNVPPRGTDLDRRLAVWALRKYGKHGQYTGRDQATGLSIDMIESWPEEMLRTIRAYREDNLDVNDVYLSHWTPEMLEAEQAEREAAKAAAQAAAPAGDTSEKE